MTASLPACLPAHPSHLQTLGYSEPNMRFVEGQIEYLDKAGIPDESIDLIISNCVVRGQPVGEGVGGALPACLPACPPARLPACPPTRLPICLHHSSLCRQWQLRLHHDPWRAHPTATGNTTSLQAAKNRARRGVSPSASWRGVAWLGTAAASAHSACCH